MPDVTKPDTYPLGEMFASSWYMKIDDNLRITSYNALASVRLEVRYRFVDGEGKISANQEAQAPNTDRTAKSTIYVTPEGWLLGGEVFVSGAAPLDRADVRGDRNCARLRIVGAAAASDRRRLRVGQTAAALPRYADHQYSRRRRRAAIDHRCDPCRGRRDFRNGSDRRAVGTPGVRGEFGHVCAPSRTACRPSCSTTVLRFIFAAR
jgi:hypothetical protein